MTTLRGQEAARLQSELRSLNSIPLSKVVEKKYRDAAPEVVSDIALLEVIEKFAGDEAAILSAIENMWHEISDERAVIGSEWETSDRNKKGKKKSDAVTTSERSGGGGRGRGKSVPPRGGNNGGRVNGRGLSNGRPAVSSSRPEADRSRDHNYPPKTKSTPTATAQHTGSWGGDPDISGNTTDFGTPSSDNQKQDHNPALPAWSSGLSLAQKLKQAEEQKAAALLAAAIAAQNPVTPEEKSPEVSTEESQQNHSRQGRSRRKNNKSNSASTNGSNNNISNENNNGLSNNNYTIDNLKSISDTPYTNQSIEQQLPPPPPQLENESIDYTSITTLSESDRRHLQILQQNQGDLSEVDPEIRILLESQQHILNLTESTSTSNHEHQPQEHQHTEMEELSDNVAELSIAPEIETEQSESLSFMSHSELEQQQHTQQPITSSTPSTNTPVATTSHTQSLPLDESSKPYVKMGKWEAPLEALDRSSFQFGSFGTFEDNSTSNNNNNWNLTDNNNNGQDDNNNNNGMVWGGNVVTTSNDSSQSQQQLQQESSRYSDAPPPGLPPLDSNKQQQQQVSQQSAVGSSSVSNTLRKAQSDMDTLSKTPQMLAIQQQQQQQQQQYYQQQLQQQHQSLPPHLQHPGVPPGLGHQLPHSGMSGAGGSRGGGNVGMGLGGGSGSGAGGAMGGLPSQQMPYYGLDMSGQYMHPAYATAAAVATTNTSAGPVAAATTTAAAVAGGGPASTGTSLQQVQQQAYSQPPPPGMYNTAPYNPYFYGQQAFYYNNPSGGNFYGRGNQSLYQPPRGPYVSDPYSNVQGMGGSIYPDMYGQSGMGGGGQFGDSVYGTMPAHSAQSQQQSHHNVTPGAVGSSIGKKNIPGGGGVAGGSGPGAVGQNTAHLAANDQHSTIGHGGHAGGYSSGYGNPNNYSHNTRDTQAGQGQWSSYPQSQGGWSQQQQLMQQQQQQFMPHATGGGGGTVNAGVGGYAQQPSGTSQGRHEGSLTRGPSGGNASYPASYNQRGAGVPGGGNQGGGVGGGGSHQANW